MVTLNFYQNNAKDFFSQTIDIDMQNVYQPFLDNLPKGKQTILDVGCGSGRDSLFFAKQGFQVIAVDGSQNLIDLAKQNHNNIDWQCLTFDEIKNQYWQNCFTGIWACASLLHISFDNLPKTLNDLLATLVSKGILYASFKYGDSEREKGGRFFCDMNEQRWQLIKTQLKSAETLKLWQTLDNRVDRTEVWLNVLLQSHNCIK